MRLNVNIVVDGNCARNFLYLLIDTNKIHMFLFKQLELRKKKPICLFGNGNRFHY